MAETTTIWAFALILSFCFLNIDCQRYGSASETLHFPPLSIKDRFGPGMHVIEGKIQDEIDALLHRVARSATTGNSSSTANNNIPPAFEFHDNHTTLIVHWAGENSDVIIALTRNGLSGTSGSRVFVSHNYGRNYTDISARMKAGGRNAHISRYYNTPSHNSHYVFTDIEQNCIFTTTDYAETFSTHCDLPFKPRTIAINSYNSDLLLAIDQDSTEKELYVSNNFGFSWRKVQNNVRSFFWGIMPYDNASTLYVEIERDARSGNIVYKSDDLFFNRWAKTTVMSGVKDFEVRDRYLFATKKVRLFGATHAHVQLWVSSDREVFQKAEFPTPENKEYYIADASEDQVMACVNHNTTTTNLYISEVKGLRFSLSLENVVYYNPKGANKDTWLKYYTNDTFADIHRVDGMRGIYIASQLIGNSLEIDKQRSLITFDKGGEWQLINAPEDADKDEDCKKVTNCSLHLTQQLHRYYPNSHASTIMSRKSAPGIIMASGVVGQNLKTDPNVFVSADAGASWNQVLHGAYLYTFADHGGVLVAGKQYESTKQIYFSLDEGETWHPKQISEEDIRIYGILTEPGEATTVFSLFGSKVGRHSWILIQVNMSDSFTSEKCRPDEYKWWSFSLKNDTKTCLLGRHMLYQRRLSRLPCYNGEAYVREMRTENCPCTRMDFECDFGFLQRQFSYDCVQDPLVDANSIHRVPSPCPQGTYYPYSRGYRKVEGDTCTGGEEHRYAPLMYSCPIEERREFVIYSTKTKISRINLDNNVKDDLVTQGLEYVSAVEFDYQNNCVFWADITLNKISRVCLRGNEREVVDIVTRGVSHVESLAFDWTARTLYWVDSITKGIYVVNEDGHFKRTLFEGDALFDHPRGLALDPHHGYLYWTDWSSATPHIQRAWMDGTNSSIETVVNSTYLRKPFGLAIDLASEKLYWTDSGLFKIMSSDLDGSNVRTLVHGSYNLPHPYSIGIYKNNIYWTDPFKQAVMTASKQLGSGVESVQRDTNVVDLKVVSHTSQSGGSACTSSSCSQLCMPIPPPKDNKSGRNRTCKCGDASKHSLMTSGDEQCLCETGEIIRNGTCFENGTVSQTCSADRFQCDNNHCIAATWRCDHDNDCGDHSDERDCPYSTCPATSFTCADGRCIPSRWRCDFDNDCGDSSDENNCVYATCSSEQFRCNNSRCINKSWVCDLDNDCHDGSDEINCNHTVSCNQWEFRCNDSQCISNERVCDGNHDCSDGSDEGSCHNITCPPWRTLCRNESRCIFRTWLCDGENDCSDGSDEDGCSTTMPPTLTTGAPSVCHSWQFACDNGLCVWHASRCDGYNDCGDNSDEQQCGAYQTTSTTTPAPSSCPHWMWMCHTIAQCIPAGSVCNGKNDCRDETDERDCAVACPDLHFECYEAQENETRCIWESWVCDGYSDCAHGEDEKKCGQGPVCSGQFPCLYSEGCVPLENVCNGVPECEDGTDEDGCINSTTVVSWTTPAPTVCADKEYQCRRSSECISWFYVCSGESECPWNDDEDMPLCLGSGPRAHFMGSTQAENVTVTWDKGSPRITGYIVSVIPQNSSSNSRISPLSAWKNYTVHGSVYEYTIRNLKPRTGYLVSVYTNVSGHIYAHPSPKLFTTKGGKPSAPTHFNVHLQPDTMNVNISWEKPHRNTESVYGYRIYYKDQTVHIQSLWEVDVADVSLYTQLFSRKQLQTGHKYELWVTALSYDGEGAATKHKTVVFKKASWEDVENVTVTFTNTAATLTWSKDKSAVEYLAEMRFNMSMSDDDDVETSVRTRDNNVTFPNICPGHTYTFRVFPIISVDDNKQEGQPTVITQKAPGTQIQGPGPFSLILTAPTEIKVVFSKQDGKKPHILYYSKTDGEIQNFLKMSKNVTMTTPYYNLNSLQACERYYFRASFQYGCPVTPVYSNVTLPDSSAAPKNLRVDGPVYSSSITANLTWDAPCNYEIEKLKYVIEKLTKSLDNKVIDKQTLSVSGSSSTLTIWHVLTDLQMNLYYVVRVRTSEAGSSWSNTVIITPKSYEAVEITRAEHVGNGQVYLAWRLPRDDVTLNNNPNVSYHIIVKNVTDSSQVTSVLTRNTTYTMTLDLGHTYAVSINFSTNNRTFGPAARVEVTVYNGTAEAPPATGMLTTTNLVVILVPIGVVVIVLVSLLTIYIVRHRRLQRSFLAFANSHYDPRSGTTTFTAADDLGDDDDTPLIQGFSDDVPMVIA